MELNTSYKDETSSANRGTSGHRTAGLETMTVVTDIMTAAFRALLQANNVILPSNRSLILTHFSHSHYNGSNEWLKKATLFLYLFKRCALQISLNLTEQRLFSCTNNKRTIFAK
jgi:hypothetical protein